MKLVPPVAAFLLACLVVGMIWSSVTAIWSPRKTGAEGWFEGIFVISWLVAVTSALPAFALGALATTRGTFSYKSAAIGGFVIGAALFVLFFSSWVSDSLLRGYAELIVLGGLLGLCGGLVFMFVHQRLSRVLLAS